MKQVPRLAMWQSHEGGGGGATWAAAKSALSLLEGVQYGATGEWHFQDAWDFLTTYKYNRIRHSGWAFTGSLRQLIVAPESMRHSIMFNFNDDTQITYSNDESSRTIRYVNEKKLSLIHI